MSNEICDDPMDTGAAPPAGEEPKFVLPSTVPFDIIAESPLEMFKQAIAPLMSEKKEKEKDVDEKYDLTVLEPAIDVESLGCGYDGNAFFLRARFIAKHCPTLRIDALIALINYLKSHTNDITHYTTFFNDLEADLTKKEFKIKAGEVPLPQKDSKWVEETGAAWQGALDQYQIEFKRHKDEGVKESTRRAMEDLFQHYMSAGKTEDAIRLYSRGIRDYCTQLKHSINMWMNWIEVSILGNDWGKLESITTTAFRSLKDADDAEKNNQQQQRGDNATYLVDQNAPSSSLSNKQLIETALAKCLTAQTLLKLRNKKYQQVVDNVLMIKTECLDPKWFVTSSDLGIYSVLCAMATLNRQYLKLLVGGSSGDGTIRKLLESEPLFFEMLTAYVSSRFGRCFEIMNSVKSRLLLDPFISRQVEELFTKIRQRCVVQYLQPYSTIKMQTMCDALGCPMAELQKSLVELAEEKDLKLRIDQKEGIIRMVDTKDEESTLRSVDETCNRAIIRAQSLIWKATLAAANIHSISDKETRQKRKNQKDFSRPGGSNVIDLEDVGGADEFQSFDNMEPRYEDLGDI